MKKTIFFLALAITFIACKKTEQDLSPSKVETVEVAAKGSGGGTTTFYVRIDDVTLNPSASPEPYVGAYGYISSGGGSITSRGFCVSTSPLPTIANITVTAGSGSGNYWAPITGLAPGTYYIRSFAVKKGVVYYSYNQLTFDWLL
jgi:hypothetical protein